MILEQLAQFGQSPWLDYISRSMIAKGKLQDWINKGLRGVTSNPSIFNQAISKSNDYDDRIAQLKKDGKSTFEIYDALTIQDIQDAADAFKGLFEKSERLDGYVSLEINPFLANQFEEQTAEGVRLFKKVNRPNVMIKVPATRNGVKVVEELIAQGINVNVTLIFSLEQYRQTAAAYIRGLSRFQKSGGNVKNVRSVASVFVSRVDTLIDKLLEEKANSIGSPAKATELLSLAGLAAVANCHVVYEEYSKIFSSSDFLALEKMGGHKQRVLWGSTSTKNPKYPDIKYVTDLIALNTVNTIPESTLIAFVDHGSVKNAFDNNYCKSHEILTKLKNVGIDIDAVCAQLLQEGLVAFDKAFEELLKSIETKAGTLCSKV